MLVIVADSEHYELVGDHAEQLWNMQQQNVTVHGHVVREAYGPGFPAQLKVEAIEAPPATLRGGVTHELANSFVVQRVIDEWIEFYNEVRPRSALGGRTPSEAYRGVAGPVREVA